VTLLRRDRDAFQLELGDETVRCGAVVVATGAFQRPTPPIGAEASGRSGCEIAQELLDDGRAVHLSVGRCSSAPRRYRGREIVRWMVDLGLMDDQIEALPSRTARVAGHITVSGARRRLQPAAPSRSRGRSCTAV
jgi:cation diffusion facilitator CzcD-associated flavoprotein CzcO